MYKRPADYDKGPKSTPPPSSFQALYRSKTTRDSENRAASDAGAIRAQPPIRVLTSLASNCPPLFVDRTHPRYAILTHVYVLVLRLSTCDICILSMGRAEMQLTRPSADTEAHIGRQGYNIKHVLDKGGAREETLEGEAQQRVVRSTSSRLSSSSGCSVHQGQQARALSHHISLQVMIFTNRWAPAWYILELVSLALSLSRSYCIRAGCSRCSITGSWGPAPRGEQQPPGPSTAAASSASPTA